MVTLLGIYGLNVGAIEDKNPKVTMCLYTLAKLKELESDNEPSLDEKHTPKVELKPLSSSLKYGFLCLNSMYHMIVNINLSALQINSLLRVLPLCCQAIGYILDDLQGSHPYVRKHHTLMEDCPTFN